MFRDIINAKDLLQLIEEDDTIILDCRRERNKERISGAQYVDFEKELTGQILSGITGRHPLPRIDEFVKCCQKWGIGEEKQVVVYDESSGAWASRLWWMLKWLGYENVAVLDGGWNYWKSQDMPVTSSAKVNTPGDFQPKERSNLLARRSDVKDAQNESRILIVDARASARYKGDYEPIDPIAGHIPTAINLPFSENLDEMGMWRSKQQIQNRFKPVISKSDSVNQTIMYCGSGVTACHNILATQYADLPMPRLYVGSWSEWINTLKS